MAIEVAHALHDGLYFAPLFGLGSFVVLAFEMLQLPFEFVMAFQPGRIERPIHDCFTHRAIWLRLMLTVGKPATLGQGSDLCENFFQSLRSLPELQFSH